MRKYLVFFWVGDDHDEMEFFSNNRAGSKANREDAMRAIRLRKGKYIADRAEIFSICICRD